MAINAPTGTGKSLLSLVAQRATNQRVHTVVSTIRLQEQMKSAYKYAPVLKGRSNYDCILVDGIDVSQAPCQVGFKCSLKSQCDYFVDRESAYTSDYAVFNYQLFMNLKEFSDTFRTPDILFCDEAHLAHLEIEKFMTATLSDRDIAVQGWRRPRNLTVEGMADWAGQYLVEVEEDMEKAVRWIYAVTGGSGATIRGSARDYKRANSKYNRLRGLKRTLAILLRAGIDHESGTNRWVFDKLGATYQVRPVFVEDFASEVLFDPSQKVVLMSATIGAEDIERLGIDDYTFIEVGSTYNPKRRPIHYMPVGHMSRKTEDTVLPVIIDAMVDIIHTHNKHGQKGIIHSVSYERGEVIANGLEGCGAELFVHDAENKNEVIEEFKSHPGPAVLISPSVQEGEDFPYDEARYILVPKVMWLSIGDKVVRERLQLDPEWYSWKAVQDLIQAAGRGMRSEDDTCVVYILDQQFEKLVQAHKDDMPDWFKQAIKSSDLDIGR